MLAYKKLSDKKNYIVYKTINYENKKFNNNIRDLVIRKKVYNIINLSPNEILLKIEKENLTNKDHLKILNKILRTPIDSNFINKRTLFELLKLSLLNKDAFYNVFNTDTLLILNEKLTNVSCETSFISHDFIILSIIDNIICKSNEKKISDTYINLKNKITKNMLSKNYLPENKEKEVNYICWINKLSKELINNNLSIDDFISICKRTNKLIICYKNFYENLFNILQYIENNYSKYSHITNYKNEIEDLLYKNKLYINLSIKEIENFCVSILSSNLDKSNNIDEFFFAIKNINFNDFEIIKYVINILSFIMHFDKKYNLFYIKNIREGYFNTITHICKNNNYTELNESLLTLLVQLLHVDYFFAYYRQSILENIVFLLNKTSLSGIKLNTNNYYKYCDILDYFISNNLKYIKFDFIFKLFEKNKTKEKTLDKFKLTYLKLSKTNLNTPLFTNTKTTKDIIQNFINLHNTCDFSNRTAS